MQLHDAAVKFVEFFGFRVDLHAQAGTRFVHEVDGLVGQEAVGDVAARQSGCGDDCRIGDAHTMVQFVFFLDAAQDGNRVFNGWLVDKNRLEAPCKGCVFFNVFAVLVERCGTDAMQFAAGESWL